MGLMTGQICSCNEHAYAECPLMLSCYGAADAPADAPSDRQSACKLTSGPQRSHQSFAARDGGASEDKGNLP